MTTSTWRHGDRALLSLPSRDSHGYSKRSIHHLTVPVIVIDTHQGGRHVTVTPEGGEGTARIESSRLTPHQETQTTCELCGERATRFVEEPLHPANNAHLCDTCAPRYIAGRVEIFNGPRVINIRPITTSKVTT